MLFTPRKLRTDTLTPPNRIEESLRKDGIIGTCVNTLLVNPFTILLINHGKVFVNELLIITISGLKEFSKLLMQIHI